MVEAKRSTDRSCAQPDTPEEIRAYQHFFEEMLPKLVRMLMAKEGASEDQAQEAAFESLAEVLERWREITHPNTWARRAARSIFIKAQIRDRRRPDLERAGQNTFMIDPREQLSPQSEVDGRDWVEYMIADLPDTQRAVMRLKALQGLSDRQIADKLGINEANVRSTARHARIRLKERLPPDHAAQQGIRTPAPRKGEAP